jgi:hypothetical protein
VEDGEVCCDVGLRREERREEGRRKEDGREEERGCVGEGKGQGSGGMRRNWGPSRPAGTKHTARRYHKRFFFSSAIYAAISANIVRLWDRPFLKKVK